MRVPNIHDRIVAVRAYITDEAFGFDHWRAAQFAAPVAKSEGRAAVLLMFDTDEERDEYIKRAREKIQFPQVQEVTGG